MYTVREWCDGEPSTLTPQQHDEREKERKKRSAQIIIVEIMS